MEQNTAGVKMLVDNRELTVMGKGGEKSDFSGVGARCAQDLSAVNMP